MPVPATSASTMFVSTPPAEARRPGSREPGGELARAAVVVGEPVDHRVERDEAGRGGDARPCARSRRRAAAASRAPARRSSRSPASSAPNGARQALVQASATEFAGAASVGERHAERDRRVRQPRPVEVDAAPCRCAAAASASVSSTRDVVPPAPRVRVLEAEQRRAALGDRAPRPRPGRAGRRRPTSGARLEPRELGDPHRLGRRTCEAASSTTCSPGRADVSSAARFAIEHVGTKTAASLPSSAAPRRSSSLTFSSSPTRRPAELGRAHRLPHLVRRERAEVGAEVDHVSARAAGAGPGRAPVCSPPSTTAAPLTSTSSTPCA